MSSVTPSLHVQRTDMMCHPKSSGGVTIDYADRHVGLHSSGWWVYPTPILWWNVPLPMWWCTQTQQHLLIGDVNGDGRSDLICHDTSTGVIGWQLADGMGHFDGTTAGAAPGGFCTGPDNWLYVGEFNGYDANRVWTNPWARSDLICANRTTGKLSIQLSHTPSTPYNGVIDEVLSAGRLTGNRCTTAAQCNASLGMSCEAGVCVERLCSAPNSDITIGDLTGDGLSDVLCTYYSSDSDGNPRNDMVIGSSGIRAWGGVQDHAGIFTKVLSWENGSASSALTPPTAVQRARRLLRRPSPLSRSSRSVTSMKLPMWLVKNCSS